MDYLFWPMLGVFAISLAVAYRILTGCRHVWETKERVPVIPSDGRTRNTPIAFDYELRCTKCGTIRKKRV